MFCRECGDIYIDTHNPPITMTSTTNNNNVDIQKYVIGNSGATPFLNC